MAALRSGTVSLLFDLLADGTACRDRETEFYQLYAHPDYAMEIDRYLSRGVGLDLEPNELAESLRGLQAHRDHAPSFEPDPHELRLRKLITHLESYKERWKGFADGWQDTLSRAGARAGEYLPPAACIPDIDVLVTVGLGDSFGWPYKNVIHFDLVRMLDDFESFPQLENLLAHELHHVGYESLLTRAQAETSAKQFLLFLGYEGMAIKFFNHPDSVFSRCLALDMCNYQIVAEDWQYYRDHCDFYFRQFQSDYRRLRLSPDSDISSVVKKWMNPLRIDEPEKMLSQYPNYFMGSEIIGMVFDHFGLRMIFDLLFGDAVFEDVYDPILEKVGMREFRIRE